MNLTTILLMTVLPISGFALALYFDSRDLNDN